jgi:protein-tyrosine kinase
MEKIQKALEKARQARAAVLGSRVALFGGADGRGVQAGSLALERLAPGTWTDRRSEDKLRWAADRKERVVGLRDEAWQPAATPPLAESGRPPPEGDAARSETQVVRLSPRILGDNRVLATGSEGAAADAFRILRTQVLARLEARRGHALAVCAAGQGDGKTLVAVNLALAIVRQLDRRVVLVDLDLRRPTVQRYLGLQLSAQVSDYLRGLRRLEECLVQVGDEQLLLLPQVESVQASSELMASAAMGSLIGQLRSRFPDAILIYDCPPLLTTDDALVVMGHADGCLLVIHEAKTRKAELLRAAELVGEKRLLGTVLNNARWSSASSYYYG